jgi:copper resistance protein B
MRIGLLMACIAVSPAFAQEPHAGHGMSSIEHARMDMPMPVSSEASPAVTDAERAAAFPDLSRTTMRQHMDDDPLNFMVLVDRLEVRSAQLGSPLVWDANLWIGRDFNKLLLRTEGEYREGHTEEGNIEAFWARPVSRWWDLVVGAREDFRPKQTRSWAALGVVGLAPYRFHVEATAYIGESARTALALQAEYELLLTNRLILQPRLELNLYGKEDRSRGIGSGLSDLEVGLRLRYELRREIAPYLGVAWVNRFGQTAELTRAAGMQPHELQALAGLRAWY